MSVLLLVRPASSSVAERLSIGRMAEISTVIARASVEGTVSYWDGGRIFTDVTLSVEEAVTGCKAGEKLVVRQPGGVAGGIGMKVLGTPEFEKGAAVIVFLVRDRKRPEAFNVAGMKQGLFKVSMTGQGVEAVSRDLDGLDLVSGADGLRYDDGFPGDVTGFIKFVKEKLSEAKRR